ncbi:MAG TPA: iron dicitrate transport regulator FecR, partial [Xanthomonadaceae bacterium]|nr:iron dicitrate transport regulator FecR [Xanthomonadaceae bacterium]
MALPKESETLMYREAAEAADVIAAQFARNRARVAALA